MRTALVRTALVVACATVIVVAAAFAPLALREIDAFRVRSVELVGAQHLTAAAAAAAAGITTASNVFDDPNPWLESLHTHPLIADVRIERRVPGTLVLHIEEAVPVAFARTPELRAMGSNGRILPVNGADEDMDLPVLSVRTRVSGQGRAVDAQTLTLVRFLAHVARTEPGLVGWISEADMHGDAIRLVLRSATDAEVLVPAEPSADRLRELHLTLAELATPQLVQSADSAAARAGESELSRVQRIDVRFHDQIVVSLQRGKS
jgi:hypothetical protein